LFFILFFYFACVFFIAFCSSCLFFFLSVIFFVFFVCYFLFFAAHRAELQPTPVRAADLHLVPPEYDRSPPTEPLPRHPEARTRPMLEGDWGDGISKQQEEGAAILENVGGVTVAAVRANQAAPRSRRWRRFG
jgi:hypothetical protein